jgi:hypothetical protein
MPEERQMTVRETQTERGSIWQKEEVRSGEWEEGAINESGPRRQTEGSRRGRMSAQAMYEAGSGVVRGLNKTLGPNLMISLGEVVKRCQRSHHPLTGSGSEVSSGWRPRKRQ